jgi:hypothetical protein
MRSAGLFAVLIGLILVTGSGCRELSTENTDRNRAPETWLSAAPVDTIAGGGMTRVAHRYRASWAGADIDGEVVGFFVAVTETTVEASTGRPYRLPAPQPSQYRFTTARESLFTFSVLEGRGSDRQHALYVYAVDNQGRVDPTPAVTHFVARDQSLPTIRFLRAEGTGKVYEFDASGNLVPRQLLVPLRDSTEVPIHAPYDTIPTGGAAYFEWIGEDRDFASSISGYLYKLTENELVRVDSTTTSAEYGTGFGPAPGPIPIGRNTFRVRAIDEAGGTTQPDAVRQFFVNFSPDTWFAGPDPIALAPHLLADSLGFYLPADSTGRDLPYDFPGNPFGADTLETLPAERKAMDGLDVPRADGGPSFRPKTFLMGRTRLDRKFRWYIAEGGGRPDEGDTVAFGSRLTFRFGGLDRDSPYDVLGGTPDNPFPVLRSGPLNGSPVAFMARIAYQRINGAAILNPWVTPFPNVDVLDPFGNPVVLYHVEDMRAAGVGYVQVRAVDGNRTSDDRIGDPVNEAPNLSEAMSSKLLIFQANFKPGLMTVSPMAGEVVNPPGDRLTVTVRATDPDPHPANPRPLGSNADFLTMYLGVRARIYAEGEELLPEEGWQDPILGYYSPDVQTPGVYPYSPPISLELVVPPSLPAGPAILEIEVVDNADQDLRRTIRVPVRIYWRVGP